MVAVAVAVVVVVAVVGVIPDCQGLHMRGLNIEWSANRGV